MSDEGSIMNYNGGAVVAMMGKGCVAIACDHRFGRQMQMVGKDRLKVYRLGEKLFVGLAGLATDSDTMHENLKYRVKLYKLREEREISPQALAKMTSHMCYERRFGPYFTEPVIAGIGEDDEPFVSGMDLIGAETRPGNFVVSGTCSESLLGMCESLWKPDQEPEDLFETICQVMLSACDRDALSGNGATIWLLTKDKLVTREVKTRAD
eukprot:RCo020791